MRQRAVVLALTLVTLSVATGYAVAQANTTGVQQIDTSALVDWATVASALGAVLLAVIGAYLVHINSQLSQLSEALWQRVVQTERQIEELHKTLLKEYHTKEDLREVVAITLRPILDKLTSLSSDMDAVYRELLRTTSSTKYEDSRHERTERGDS